MREAEGIDRNRRKLILGGIGAALAVAHPVRNLATPNCVFASQELSHLSNDATAAILDRIFESDDKEVMKLVKDAMDPLESRSTIRPRRCRQFGRKRRMH
jgi:hypothetical protein